MTRGPVAWICALGLGWGASASAGDGLAVAPLDARFAWLPLEAAQTEIALRQIASADAARTRHGLLSLEALLALPGVRAAAVDDVLESAGAEHMLTQLAATEARGSDQLLWAGVVASVSERMDAAGRRDARETVATDERFTVLRPDDQHWVAGAGGSTWFRMALTAGADLAGMVRGCDVARARVFGQDGRRVGGVTRLRGEQPVRLGSLPRTGDAWVRVDVAPWCGEGWTTAFAMLSGSPVLEAGRSRGRAVSVPNDGSWQVFADGPAAQWVRFATDPGVVYTVRTFDLVGDVDTSLGVYVERSRSPVLVDDDSGSGYASRVSFASMRGDPFWIRIGVDAHNSNARFRFAIEPTVVYDMTQDLLVDGDEAKLPAAAWSGRVMSVPFEPDGGVLDIRFDAIAGTVFQIQSEMELVEMVGRSGRPAMPVRRSLPETGDWAIRDVQWRLAVESGESHLRLKAASPARSWEPWPILQVAPVASHVPTPTEAIWGSARESATKIPSFNLPKFDGGQRDRVDAGGIRWLFSEVVAGQHYWFFADGSADDAPVRLSLQWEDEPGQDVARSDDDTPIPDLDWTAERTGRVLVRVHNLGAEATAVRLGIVAEPHYHGLRVGDVVRVGRHDLHRGRHNWSYGMEGLVGRRATVTALAGMDDSGSWVVRLDADEGRWAWRTRALELEARPRP